MSEKGWMNPFIQWCRSYKILFKMKEQYKYCKYKTVQLYLSISLFNAFFSHVLFQFLLLFSEKKPIVFRLRKQPTSSLLCCQINDNHVLYILLLLLDLSDPMYARKLTSLLSVFQTVLHRNCYI